MNAYRLDPDHVLSLLSWRSCIIEPLRQEGFVAGGKLLAADPYDRHTPYVLARILYVHPACTEVKPGDVVIMAPHSFERQTHECELHNERYDFYVMHENNAQAVVEGYDAPTAEYADAANPRRGTDGNDTDVSELAIQSA